MKRQSILALSIFLLGNSIVWGAKFWEKNFLQWDRKEINRILRKSPWAHRVKFPLALSVTERYYQGRTLGADSSERSWQRSEIQQPSSSGDGPIPSQGPVREGRRMPTVPLILRWYTALPIKHAISRLTLNSSVLETQISQLEQEEIHYILGVYGFPLGFAIDPDILKTQIEDFKQHSLLKIKGQKPIALLTVERRDGQQAIEFVFTFPRNQNSSHVITLADKNVEFVTKIRGRTLRSRFKLKNMVYRGKLTL